MKAISRVLLVITASAAAQIAAADVTGTWAMNIEMQTGTSASVFVLTQKGEEITGNYRGQFGQATVTGVAKDKEIMLTYQTETQGVPIEVTYIGTVEGNTMKGRLTIAGFGDGTFKGTKQ